MKDILFVAALLIIANMALGQSAPIPHTKQLQYHNQTTTFVKAEEITDLSDYGLSAENILRQAYNHVSADSKQHTKYHQYYQGVRVLGGTQVFHTYGDQLYATSGSLAKVSAINVHPTVSKAAGKSLTLRYLQKHILATEYPHLIGQSIDFEIVHSDNVILSKTYPRPSKHYTFAHVYEVHTHELTIPFHMLVYVDAHTGKYITSISKIEDTNVHGHGDGFYHQDITFNVDSIGPSSFILRDITRGGGVFAYDIAEDYAEFEDSDNDWQFDTDQGKAALDGYYATLKYYDFLKEKFGRASIDDNDTPLTVNLNQNLLVNAFWNGNEATFGSGNCNDYNPLTTFEIVSHEFTHGLTDYTSDLVYAYESGALNESMSDIFGKALEYFYDNEHANWYIGEALGKRAGIRPFRSMIDPNERNDPKYYKGLYWVTTEADRGGVHSNSGVLNYWFYLLVEGGSGTNEGGYNFTVEGIGMEKAIQIAYLMQTSYLTELSGYADASVYAAAAATDLYGATGAEYLAVVEAWKAVGLDINDLPEPDRELDLEIVYATKNAFSDFCNDDFVDMEVTLFNQSDVVVPEGSIMSGSATISYVSNAMLTEQEITVSPQTLTSGLPSGGFTMLQLAHQVVGEPVQISLVLDLEFTNDPEPFTFNNSDDLSISDRTEAALNFVFAEAIEICNPAAGLDFEYMTFDLPICNNASTNVLHFSYSGPGGEVSFEEEIMQSLGSDHFIFNPMDNVDINSIGRLDQITLTVSYVADGQMSEIHVESYDKYFGTSFDSERLLTFEDQSEAERHLAIDGCGACLLDFENEIRISNLSNASSVEDCVPLAEYNEIRFSTFGSTVSLCADLSGVSDEAFLVFDLKMDDVGSFDEEQNGYLHNVDVFVNEESILDELITTTGGAYERIVVPLGTGFSGTLDIQILAQGTSVYLDNVGIDVGILIATKDEVSATITYNNPASDQLIINSADELLTGTMAKIYSSDGALLMTQNISGSSSSLDVSHLPMGLYMLQVSDGGALQFMGKVVHVR